MQGLRLYNGTWFCMEDHMKRLYESCKYMDINIGRKSHALLSAILSHDCNAGMSPEQLCADLDKLVELNGMKSGVHARLMVSRLLVDGL